MKRIVLTALLALGAGCAEYQDAQIQLINQAQKGLALVSQAKVSETARADALDRLQRKGLDDAFDRDVREREELSPDWVIEHRKAYVAGLEAVQAQRSAARAAIEANARNIEAVDAALKALRRITQAESQLVGGEK